jgi:hypothetical protein
VVDAESALLYSCVATSSSLIDTAASNLGNWWGNRGEVVTSAQKMRVQELNAASMQQLAYWSSSSGPMWLALLGCFRPITKD